MGSRTVLHLIDTGGPGGAETIFLNLVKGLDAARWRSVPVVPERDWLLEALQREGARPLLVPTQGSFDVRYVGRLSRLLRRERVDLIHAHLLSTGVYGSLAGALHGVPVVCTFHGQADVSPGERYLGAKLRILNRRRNRLVFVSEALRAYFLGLGGVDPGRAEVVHNGIDLSSFTPSGERGFREELGIGPQEVLVGAVGNVRLSKDYPTFLRAAALLRRRSGRYRFVVVGDARESPLVDEFVRLRSELGLESSVTLAGFREDVARVMRSLDVFALSSSAEGFSLTTVQAMASGLPVVATRCGGPEEIVEDGVSGRLVEPRSPEALADAIEALAGDPEGAARMGRAAASRANGRFGLPSMVAGYEAVYERCLGRARPGAGPDPRPRPEAGAWR